MATKKPSINSPKKATKSSPKSPTAAKVVVQKNVPTNKSLMEQMKQALLANASS